MSLLLCVKGERRLTGSLVLLQSQTKPLQQYPISCAGSEPAKDAEDGAGVALVQACTRLRLHFSHITVAVQEAIRSGLCVVCPC